MKSGRGLILLLLALLLVAPATSADATSIEGGTVSLSLAKGLKKRMGEAGVRFSGLSPGKVRGRVATLPVDGGQMEGPPAKGVVIPLGGIRFSAGRKTVRLAKIGLDVTHGELGAEVAGKRLIVASFRGAGVVRDGFDIELTIPALRLTPRAARVLDRELGLSSFFKAGSALAGASLDLQLVSIKAREGTISLTLDEGFRSKLQSREVAVSTYEIQAATSAIPPAISLPISYGAISPGLARGTIGSDAGLRLTQGDGPVFFRDMFLVPFEIDLDSKAVNAWVTFQSAAKKQEKAVIAAADFTGSTVTADRVAGTVSASAVTATLSGYAATLLNQAFPPAAFNAGEPLGTIAFTLHG